MIRNYFIVAFRNFWGNKVFSLINLIGLSIGISAALVIYSIVHHEFSFDTFEKDDDRIYRVVTDFQFSGNALSSAAVPSPLRQAIEREATGVDRIAGFQMVSDASVAIPANSTDKPVLFRYQTGLIFADDQYFGLLPYTWLAGSVDKSLKEPFKVVLTLERALTYFPGKNVSDIIGQKIIYSDSIMTTVSGIVKDLRRPTDFDFKEFISLSTIPNSGLKNLYSWDNWYGLNPGTQLFVKLASGNNPRNLEDQLKSVLKKYNRDANKDSKNTMIFHLQPLSDLHFNSAYGAFGRHTAHKPTLYGLLTIAAILILLGCINFINLTTAHAVGRSKEIGIRKTMGGTAGQIMTQFLLETFLLTFISALLSVVLAPFLIRIFEDFTPKEMHYSIFLGPDLILFLIGLIITVSFLSGYYPSLVLSQYNPVTALKNQGYSGNSGSRKAWLRKGLTVLQFFIAQVFIICTLITVKQIRFISNKDLGIKKDAIILFNVQDDLIAPPGGNNKKISLLNDLKAIPGIQMIALGSQPPSSSDFPSIGISYKDGKKEIEADVLQLFGDTNYIKLYNIRLLAGRLPYHSDTTREYLINETYMHILGCRIPEEILNKSILGLPIVGVIKDFHQESLHTSIRPLMFSVAINNSATFQVTLRSEGPEQASWSSTIDQIKKAYEVIYPQETFNYSFFDVSIARFYKNEQDLSHLLTWATGLSIFIGCMGLLGLVIYITRTRTKEIGVRKVLGASLFQIFITLSKDFIKLILTSFVIAIPVAWWTAHEWLQNFAFRTSISWWVFLSGGLLMTLIALTTLSIQTIRAGIVNPAKSLRIE